MRFRVPIAGLVCFKQQMERFVLTDAQWAKMELHCLGKPSGPGRSGSDNRRFAEAVLWIARGMTTKILALTDALGTLVRFVLLPGQRHDTVGVASSAA